MSIVTFWNGTKDQTGITSSSVAFATMMAIEHNIKVLLISTSMNDDLIESFFWGPKKEHNDTLFGLRAKSSFLDESGIQELERIARSNKMTPSVITNYTKIVLRDRLEVLPRIKWYW